MDTKIEKIQNQTPSKHFGQTETLIGQCQCLKIPLVSNYWDVENKTCMEKIIRFSTKLTSDIRENLLQDKFNQLINQSINHASDILMFNSV